MTRITPLNHDLHKNIKIKPGVDFSLFKRDHIIPLVVHEFVAACNDVPIAFVKNEKTGQFQAAAILGLKPEQNLYEQDGKWMGMYVPAIMSNIPFALIADAHDNTRMMLGFDEDSNQVSTEEGVALFDADGKESAELERRKNAVQTYFEHSQVTMSFIDLLTQMDLLAERTISIDVNGDKITLNGLYFVDEEKLMGLADDQFLDLKKRGFLPVIYAHMISFNQVRRLGRMKTLRGAAA